MPRPATGKTPVRNMRMEDEVWLPALARAVAEGRTLTDVLEGCLRRYNAGKMQPDRSFTFANWPEVAPWVEANPAFHEMAGEVVEAVGWSDPEYLAVATWLAVTRHPGDPAQQQRVVTGFLLGRALQVPSGGWRSRYRDSRHLSATLQALLGSHLPLAAGPVA